MLKPVPVVLHPSNEFVKLSPWKILVFLGILFPCSIYSQDPGWAAFSLGSPPLRLSLPGVPIAMETQIQPSLLEVMRAYYAYEYEDSINGISVMLLQTTYAQHIHPDFTIISDQTIRDLTSRGAVNIKYQTSSIETEGKKGFRQEGTLIFKGNAMDFTTNIVNEGSNVWKVIILERTDNADTKRTTHSILDSITFKEN
ncbi:MAG TPA: hypothetical protein VFG10_14585 [Saprospiraceae bacterium]|nr:hypothetical protein [Saprospiraceae bacterium]